MLIRNQIFSQVFFDDTLFSKSEKKSGSSTLFSSPDNLDLTYYKQSSPAQKPASLAVSGSVSGATAKTEAVNSALSKASTLSGAVRAGLSDAKSMVEQLAALAAASADSGTSDTGRADLAREAGEVLNNLYNLSANSSFKGVTIMRGGSASAGPDGAAVSLGDTILSNLGLQDFDITTQSGAEDALDAAAEALQNLADQTGVSKDQGGNLDAEAGANTGALAAVTTAAGQKVSSQYARTSLQNSKSAIRDNMSFAIGVQASNLRLSSQETMSAMFSSINTVISTARDEFIKRQEEAAKQAEDDAAARDSAAKTQTGGSNQPAAKQKIAASLEKAAVNKNQSQTVKTETPAPADTTQAPAQPATAPASDAS
jgi:flagellin-like hook-associated protein FlgL